MLNHGQQAEQGPTSPGVFATTHWSVVRNASHENSTQGVMALEKLARAYWYPLYAQVRRKGYDAHTAQDLTQEFFARMIQGNSWGNADPNKGRFRSWLLGALNHFLAHEWEKARAEKRGGGAPTVPLDETLADQRYQRLIATDSTPENLYDRQWALTILERAAIRLRASYVAEDRLDLYERLKVFVSGEGQAPSYAESASQLGLSESAVKSTIRRLRQRFHQYVREEVAQTVCTPGDLDDELRYLIEIIRS